MKSLRFLDRRAGYSLASLGLLLGVVAPAAIPALASAGQLTTRSIQMSSASASAASTSYTVKFTGATDIATAGGAVIDFCSESPLITDTCTGPTGMDTSSVGVGTVKYAGSAASSNGTVASLTGDHAVEWTAGADYTHATTLEIPLTGIVNPSTVGTFYARITTYTSAAHLATDSTLPGTYDDEGAVALSTSDNAVVTAYVLESMTFCVANIAPTKNCTGISGHNPSMTLGETTGTVTALTPSAVSHGDDFAQLSTNAIGGATVNLKSNTTGCGGLIRNYGATNCDITAQNTDGSGAGTITAGNAKFGIKLGTAAAASDATDAAGSLAASGNYNTSRYFLDYTAGDAAGVTSPFGSALFNSTGPVSNMNMPVTFGASISNTTPAGIYGATLNMVATGTF